MLRIRLRRVGRKKAPSYRIVVADSRAPRDGRFKEIIGFYNPLPDPSVVELDEEKAAAWLKKGAQPSGPVARILIKRNLMKAAKANEGTH
ncbi:MAG: 30S ribosomal protein S16 [Chloroflexi bacterium]|nr:30S ribosomal protein S16 [Chloroflexota bacterium]